MADSALQVVSVAEAKRTLRVADSDDDTLITACIEAGVSYVIKKSNIPLIDRTVELEATRPAKVSDPICLWTQRFIKSVDSAVYFAPDDAFRDAPGGSIASADLGRVELAPLGTVVYPPADGWPAIKSSSKFEFTVTAGFDIDENSKALRQAVILAAREFYEGHREISPLNPLNNLILSFEVGRGTASG